ncbi:hypothetical protein TEA_001726 [Camellia sinensis var. sinensis]|uniref:Uncharacterized protein n=1 Tax=Camellia sinensis var. sinensis TaxID=542762 RepID=A0A4S4DQ22_CAMSN|nr:hypothetical protein TEA_001726 [Camellia sinensis var. sinensis]
MNQRDPLPSDRRPECTTCKRSMVAQSKALDKDLPRLANSSVYFIRHCVHMSFSVSPSRFQRPPGPIPSSMLGLEALTGGLEDFGFEDYLNDPRESETFRPLDMHHGMEVNLGLAKGPACPSFF